MSAARRMLGAAPRAVRAVCAPLALASVLLVVLSVRPVAAQTEVVEYYAQDALGSIRIVFNASGAAIARADYEPFGELFTVPNMPGGQLPAQQFTGQERDPEASQDYFGARFYTPRTGRFSQVDPVYAGLFDPQQWNRYAYARNNPLTFVDPSGKQTCFQSPANATPGFTTCDAAPIEVTAPTILFRPIMGGDGWGPPGAELDTSLPPTETFESLSSVLSDLRLPSDTQLLLILSMNGGAKVGFELGTMFLLDTTKGTLTTYWYGGLGGGLGAGLVQQAEVGLVNVGDPSQLSGLGIQVSAFAAAGVGTAGSAFISIPSLTTGTAGGVAVGGGGSAGIQGTWTTMEATYDLNKVPAAVAMSIAPYVPYFFSLLKVP